ncbi:hypothetical protein [Planococcus sp. ISL-109]|nr:hypothetical protein [Planococcus sp. ISL-109]
MMINLTADLKDEMPIEIYGAIWLMLYEKFIGYEKFAPVENVQ